MPHWSTFPVGPQPPSAKPEPEPAAPAAGSLVPTLSLTKWKGPLPSKVAAILTGQEVKIHEYTRELVFTSEPAQFAS